MLLLIPIHCGFNDVRWQLSVYIGVSTVQLLHHHFSEGLWTWQASVRRSPSRACSTGWQNDSSGASSKIMHWHRCSWSSYHSNISNQPLFKGSFHCISLHSLAKNVHPEVKMSPRILGGLCTVESIGCAICVRGGSAHCITRSEIAMSHHHNTSCIFFSLHLVLTPLSGTCSSFFEVSKARGLGREWKPWQNVFNKCNALKFSSRYLTKDMRFTRIDRYFIYRTNHHNQFIVNSTNI